MKCGLDVNCLFYTVCMLVGCGNTVYGASINQMDMKGGGGKNVQNTVHLVFRPQICTFHVFSKKILLVKVSVNLNSKIFHDPLRG